MENKTTELWVYEVDREIKKLLPNVERRLVRFELDTNIMHVVIGEADDFYRGEFKYGFPADAMRIMKNFVTEYKEGKRNDQRDN
jgi:hypothetical protein